MSKSVLGESSESLGSRNGETFGLMPVGRGGAFGAGGARLGGNRFKFLCCSNWTFVKLNHLIHIHVISVLSIVKYREGQNYLEMAELQL